MTKEELLKDAAFIKEVAEKSVEDIQKAFEAKGAPISADEAKAIKDGKLSIDALDSVAGGYKDHHNKDSRIKF